LITGKRGGGTEYFQDCFKVMAEEEKFYFLTVFEGWQKKQLYKEARKAHKQLYKKAKKAQKQLHKEFAEKILEQLLNLK